MRVWNTGHDGIIRYSAHRRYVILGGMESGHDLSHVCEVL